MIPASDGFYPGCKIPPKNGVPFWGDERLNSIAQRPFSLAKTYSYKCEKERMILSKNKSMLNMNMSKGCMNIHPISESVIPPFFMPIHTGESLYPLPITDPCTFLWQEGVRVMIVACRVDDVLLISSAMDTMPGLLAHLRSHVEEGEEFLTDIVYLV